MLSLLIADFGAVVTWLLAVLFGAICFGPPVLLLILMVKTAMDGRNSSPDRRGFPVVPKPDAPPKDPTE